MVESVSDTHKRTASSLKTVNPNRMKIVRVMSERRNIPLAPVMFVLSLILDCELFLV